MSAIKALLVGVSDYAQAGQIDLDFCRNDIALMQKTLITGLDIKPENIQVMGWSRTVLRKEFIDKLLLFLNGVESEDTVILYFSGHGGTIPGCGHVLAFSDRPVRTQVIIDHLDRFPTKNKLIILDTCFSGNYSISPGKQVNPQDWLQPFFNTGCAVLASSGKNQVSNNYPGLDVSLFTYYLSLAARNRMFSHKGAISLDDIYEVLFMMLDRWNQGNPGCVQNPVYRSNIGGTITFPMKNPDVYRGGTYVSDHDDYAICSVEPVHHGNVKRLSVRAILKHTVTPEELAEINWKIIREVSYADVYQSKMAENRFTGRPANIVFCYFGYDEADIVNTTYAFRTTWTDKNQDRNHWYTPSKTSVDVQDIHIIINDWYTAIKDFEKQHTGSKEAIVEAEKQILTEAIMLSEKVIELYREYRNNEIDESTLIGLLKPILPQIDDLYFKESDLDIPPIEIHDWAYACSALLSTIHDFVFYYKEEYVPKRTPENLRQCMDVTIRRYHEDLEKLKTEEDKLNL